MTQASRQADSTTAYAYIGRKDCGCVVFAMVDDPDYAVLVAREVGSAMKRGLTIERHPIETVRVMPEFRICPHDAKQEALL